jgi:membrane-associated phospholipid phosphatase
MLARPRRRAASGWGSEAVVCVWAWLVIAGCFVGLALHAASGHVARTDLRLLNASQRLPESIEPWVTLQTRLGNPELIGACVVALALVLFVRRAWLEGLVTLSTFGVFAAVVLTKHIVAEAPPYLATHAQYDGVLESNYSFPSGHVAGLSVLASLVFLFADRLTRNGGLVLMLRLVAFIAAVTVGPGRIWLGVHYPSDVVAAYLLSGLFVLPVWFFFTTLRRTMRRHNAT